MIVLINDCTKRNIKAVTDFLQFGKKLKAAANVVQVSEQTEKPKIITKAKLKKFYIKQ